MRIQITNPNKIVEAAFTRQAADSFSLFVDVKRGYQPSSFGYNLVAPGSFDLMYENDNGETDMVALIPENDEEKERLSWTHFEQQDKRQLWIIFLPSRVYGIKA